jgi:CYTH domain-containing protein
VLDRQPGQGRYAHIEREQRWLLRSVPPGATPLADIEDLYIEGTTLRLRRVTDVTTGEVVDKLAQKVRPEPTQPEVVMLTNLYLSRDEHALLSSLPSHRLTKRRHRLHLDGRPYAVDEFGGPLEGLVLAETELDPADPRLAAPDFAVADVTDDDRYSGGGLARHGLPDGR